MQTTTINLDRLESIANPTQRERLRSYRREIFDPDHIERQLRSTPGPQAAVPQGPSPSIAPGDLAALETAGIIRKMLPDEAPRALGSIFTVAEERKQRRRFIYWPRWLNDALTTLTEHMCDVVDHSRDLQLPGVAQHDTYATTWDLEASFYQIAIPESAQPYYAFTYKGVHYCMRRLPMGLVQSPGLMQTILEILAPDDDTVRTGRHVDNVRFVGSHQAVKDANTRFRSVCAFVDARLRNEPQNEPHQEGEFLGLRYTYSAATVNLTESSAEKISAIPHPKLWSVQQLRSALGLMFWASRALRLNTAGYYAVLKFFRRKMASGELGDADPAGVWPSIYGDIARWKGDILCRYRTGGVRHPQGREAWQDDFVILYLDASTTGWGAVLCTEEEVATVGGRWHTPKVSAEINELEAEALSRALASDEITDRLRGRRVLLVHDNTSVQYTLAKGHAAAFRLNQEVETCLNRLRDVGVRDARSAYIVSAANPADPVSRQRERQQIERDLSACGVVGRSLAKSSLRVVFPA
jgi:hypothetical protein